MIVITRSDVWNNLPNLGQSLLHSHVVLPSLSGCVFACIRPFFLRWWLKRFFSENAYKEISSSDVLQINSNKAPNNPDLVADSFDGFIQEMN